MRDKNAISAKMATMIIQDVRIVRAMFTELSPKFVIRKLANVCAKMVMDRHAAIVAFLASTTIPIVFRAIVQWLDPCKRFAITMENVHACRISLANVAINVWLVSINILSVCRAIVIHTARWASRVIMRVSAIAKTTLMAKRVICVRRISTIIRCVSRAIVIQPVLLPNLRDVVLCQQVNCVNARSECKAEFAINVDHFIGI
jgi:hypothetical protein